MHGLTSVEKDAGIGPDRCPIIIGQPRTMQTVKETPIDDNQRNGKLMPHAFTMIFLGDCAAVGRTTHARGSRNRAQDSHQNIAMARQASIRER
ncbi:MAG: hypothetical protein JWM42_1265 [Burkholderia sp.]|nr:hypothetical protein [Burkholderia sp.]